MPSQDAQGASRKDKNRMTLIGRQAVLGSWGLPDSNTLPVGTVLDSILLTTCEQPCRLEDMSVEEPAIWNRTHTVWHKGVEKTECRKAGRKGLTSFLAAALPLHRD